MHLLSCRTLVDAIGLSSPAVSPDTGACNTPNTASCGRTASPDSVTHLETQEIQKCEFPLLLLPFIPTLQFPGVKKTPGSSWKPWKSPKACRAALGVAFNGVFFFISSLSSQSVLLFLGRKLWHSFLNYFFCEEKKMSSELASKCTS